MKYIYAITEENVDGCKGSATEFVCSTVPLSLEGQMILENCLTGSKQKAITDKNDSDTCDMVADAIKDFFSRTGISLDITGDPIDGYLSF